MAKSLTMDNFFSHIKMKPFRVKKLYQLTCCKKKHPLSHEKFLQLQERSQIVVMGRAREMATRWRKCTLEGQQTLTIGF